MNERVGEKALLSTVEQWTGEHRDRPAARAAAGPAQEDAVPPTESTEPPPASATIDDDVLMSLVDLDPDGSKGVIDRLQVSFLDEATQRVVELRDALRSDDPETVRNSAHRLKGSSLYFGAVVVTDLARRLEEMGTAGATGGATTAAMAGADALVDALAAEVQRLRVDLPGAMARLRAERGGA